MPTSQPRAARRARRRRRAGRSPPRRPGSCGVRASSADEGSAWRVLEKAASPPAAARDVAARSADHVFRGSVAPCRGLAALSPRAAPVALRTQARTGTGIPRARTAASQFIRVARQGSEHLPAPLSAHARPRASRSACGTMRRGADPVQSALSRVQAIRTAARSGQPEPVENSRDPGPVEGRGTHRLAAWSTMSSRG